MSAETKAVSELAALVGGKVVGDETAQVRGVASIEEADQGDITFLAHPRYRAYLGRCRASAVILGPGIRAGKPQKPVQAFIQVAEPYVAFAKILGLFHPPPRYDGGISPLAAVHPTAKLGEEVTLFPYVYVGKEVRVGRRTVLFPGVFLGDGAEVGEDCLLYPNVTVRERCRLGNRVILHAGVVIGADGFGYAGRGEDLVKIPQIGIVEIGDDVEIGANTTVDRATLGKTVIGRGTKIDNLVQIAHNVVVGEHSIIAAQTGIAGSTRIGREVVLAGQVGVVNHIEIGDKATIGPQSGVPRAVPPGAILSGGIGAHPHREWLKVMATIPRLPEISGRVRRLERKVALLARRRRKGARDHAGR